MNIEQYIEGLKTLSLKQIELLKAVYYSPNHSCTAKELAKLLNYKSFNGANRQIGAIGQRFAEIKGVETKYYIDHNQERDAFFEHIGPYTKKGWVMHKELCKALETLKIVGTDKNQEIITDRLPTEILIFEEDQLLKEGKVAQILVNRYERNSKARRICIQHYGLKCMICEFDFQEVYGNIAEGFIQVHHIVPLSELSGEYEVDPARDLIPICANCHSVIHLTRPAMKVEDLQKMVKKRFK
jgi:5-methylcytosine-specific restriction enzyme A